MLAENGQPGQQNLSAGAARVAPRIDPPPPVHFFSIESADPAREFWATLARLLDTLRLAATRKAGGGR